MELSRAYETIASSLMQVAPERWSHIEMKCQVFHNNCSGLSVNIYSGDSWVSVPLGFPRVFDVNQTVIFVRNCILKNTGNRIWGILFCLFDDGKFKIDFDYQRPDNCEDYDESMSGDEINESLNNLLSGDKKKP